MPEDRPVLTAAERALSHCDRGDALLNEGKPGAATREFQQALRLDPTSARAWYSAGCVSTARQEFAAAVECFRKALSIAPGWPEAQHNLGQALFELGQIDEALALFDKAAAGPSRELPLSTIAVVIPGSPTAINLDILAARQAWGEAFLPVRPRRPRPAVPATGPLRIAYLSSFFQRDNWMKPVWGLINHHDRTAVQVHLFSEAPASSIKHGYRVHSADRFHDISGLSNESVAQRIEEAGVQVLIDLNGYSKLRRTPVLALRPAPVIVGWFNMYATTGLACYDYLIGDSVVIPRAEEKFYGEKIVRVPGSYLTFEVAYPVPEATSPPCLTKDGIAFGCLAPLYKITPDAIAAWSRILGHSPRATLLLQNTALASSANRDFVHLLFKNHGIEADRILLAGPADHYEFLQSYAKIDIALDTFPYNGGTTTTEALWQGVPVLTFLGDRWVSRTSASLLYAANLPQFVRNDQDDYVSSAIALAASPGTPQNLAALRSTMRDRLTASSACDTAAFARNMERLYREIYDATACYHADDYGPS